MEDIYRSLENDIAERKVSKNLVGLAADADLYEPELISKKELLEFAQRLHLDRDTQRSLMNADFVFLARNSKGKKTYAAVEVSWTADDRDTNRARRNAALLRQATGCPALAIVASSLWEQNMNWNDIHWYEIPE